LDTYFEIQPGLFNRCQVAVGFFDGVHRGHQAVINHAVEAGRADKLPSVIVTFKDHPRTLTEGKTPGLLTVLPERLEIFANLGIDAALVLTFSEELCRLAANEYVKTVLHECLGASIVSIGFNHRFGRNREGDAELLKQLGKRFAFSVHVAPAIELDGIEVSSSQIREALKSGEIELASKLLGRPYTVSGAVVHGQGRGQNLGFPTANLELPPEKLLPASGVYLGFCRLTDKQKLPCLINLGFRPTVSTDRRITCEAHILGFKGDLYGRQLTIELIAYLRPEKRFKNIEQLKEQIRSDCLDARGFFQEPVTVADSGERLPA